MKKITLKGLFLAFLLLGLSFALPAAFAKAETGSSDDSTDNQAEVVKDESDTDEDEDMKEVEDESNDDQDDDSDDQDDSDEDADEDSDEDEGDDDLTGEEHRSAVGTFVQDLLKVADKEKGGIGEEVREVAKEQEESKEDVAEKIDEVKNRSGLKTFFIGTDFKNLGELRSETVKTENQIEKLTELSDKVKSADNKTTLEKQIEALKELQKNILEFIKENESKFSLFGWFVKLFQ